MFRHFNFLIKITERLWTKKIEKIVFDHGNCSSWIVNIAFHSNEPKIVEKFIGDQFQSWYTDVTFTLSQNSHQRCQFRIAG